MSNLKQGQKVNVKNGSLEAVLVNVTSPEHKKATKELDSFNKQWATMLGAVVKVSKKEDQATDSDSYTISEMATKYVQLAMAVNTSRPVGSEEKELPVDFKGITKHVRTLSGCDNSRSFKLRVDRGVKHCLLAIIPETKDKFTLDANGNLLTANKHIRPKSDIYDIHDKIIGKEFNTSMTPTIVKIEDVDMLWRDHAPKVQKGADNKSKAVDQQNPSTKEQFYNDLGHKLLDTGLTSATISEVQLVLAVLNSGISKKDCYTTIEALKNGDKTAVAVNF